MFYVVSSEYVGPHPSEHPDQSWVVISTDEPRTNNSRTPRIEGWLGTTNDISHTAHGAYETVDAARDFVDEFLKGDFREYDVDCDEDVVARFKIGRYRPVSASYSRDWIASSHEVKAATTDDEISAMVVEFEVEGHREGVQIDVAAGKAYLINRRAEAAYEAKAAIEDEAA